MSTAQSHIHDKSGWRAELSLRFARDATRTVLAERRHVGPLVVQRPFYPEADVCHVYVVHPPGGIVGGDHLRLHAAVEDGAHALITTPAATKFYRTNADRPALLQQELSVGQGTLEWLPQESIFFRNAHSSMSTIVGLTAKSHFIGWEQTCYGRPASGERFDAGHIAQNFEIWIDERPMLLDRLRVCADAMMARWGFAEQTILSTVLAYPADAATLEAARAVEDFVCTLVDGVLCCRLLNSDGDAAKRAQIAIWSALRPHIVGRAPVAPRIWAT